MKLPPNIFIFFNFLRACLVLQQSDVFSSATVASGYKKEIAVILNINARSVTQSSISIAKEIVGKDNVFVTANVEDNEKASKIIVERGYELIVPAGGDGTLCSVINAVVNARRMHVMHMKNDSIESPVETKTRIDKLPKFAFLPLGTGNGMGMLAGPRFKGRKNQKVQKTLTKLKDIVEKHENNLDRIPVVKCPMIEIRTDKTIQLEENSNNPECTHRELCFFAGAGFDSLMLNDFKILKKWSKNKPGLRRFLGSVVGYTVALFVRTLPQCLILRSHKLSIRVTVPKIKESASDEYNTDTTYWIDPRRGDTAMEITQTQSPDSQSSSSSLFPTKVADDRQLIFEGETGIVAAGTTPYYGGGIKLFPFSRVQPHHMHLRLGRIHPLIGFLNIPWIFRGSYRHYNMGCLDFLGSDFDVELSKPYPFQHSGEAVDDGVKRFILRVADEEIEFVDFLKPRLVVEN